MSTTRTTAASAEAGTPLSHWSTSDLSYRADRMNRPRWTKLVAAAKGAACNECVALQHETCGEFTRMAPRKRRAFPAGAGPTLLLCTAHAEAWKLRDLADMAAGTEGTR